ncbi:MAG: carboxypeptidase-like regulatory domain-containing protein [Mangrovibacterium sp.]
MKLTILCLFLSLMNLMAARVYSQADTEGKLTLDFQNARVEEVLAEIEEQSNFYFIYNREVVDVNRKVDVSYKKQEIREVLSGLFHGTDVEYDIRENHVILRSNSVQLFGQQTIRVFGIVTDYSGAPLPGVTVVVKGSTQGTITDAKGYYMLVDVAREASLVFSFVGMRTLEINVSGRSEVNVSMEEETIGIDEVVAIGYGTIKKSDVTGSVVSVDSEQMMKRNPLNLAQGL